MEQGRIVERLDFPFLITALITSFVALVNDPWWTVQAQGSGSILSVRVSPFYVQIDALGAPSFPYSFALGTATRVLLAVTAIALFLEAFWPRSLWRKTVFWLGLSSLVEAVLSFALMLHTAQVTFLSLYGIIPPLTGNSIIPGRVVGLDFSFYLSPVVSSSFALPFFLGLASIGVLGGSEAVRLITRARDQLVTFDFMRGLSGVFLSPPYQHAWFTSIDESLNPLSRDPDNLRDDELALSFEKLLGTMQPGATVSIVLPSWAGHLSNRLCRVVPWTGFNLERSELIYRVPGRPENELVFRKPASIHPVEPSEPESEEGQRPTHLEAVESGEAEIEVPSLTDEIEAPPVAEAIEEPVWAQPELSRQEGMMIRSAVRVIERHQEPVPYRDLLNEVYMDLLDRNVNFESSKQIEATLLGHTGKELSLIEELDETGGYVVRKWWLGERGVEAERERTAAFGRMLSGAKKGVPKVKQFLHKWRGRQRSAYVPKAQPDEDL